MNKPSKWIIWDIYSQHSTSVYKLISEAINVKKIDVIFQFRWSENRRIKTG